MNKPSLYQYRDIDGKMFDVTFNEPRLREADRVAIGHFNECQDFRPLSDRCDLINEVGNRIWDSESTIENPNEITRYPTDWIIEKVEKYIAQQESIFQEIVILWCKKVPVKII